MRKKIQGSKEEVRNIYKKLVGDERYSDVKVVEPLTEMPTKGTWEMVVDTIPNQSFTSRGIYGW